MIGEGLLRGFYASSGQQIGVALNGYLFLPNAVAQGGIIMQDANANLWLLQIGTDGRLTTTEVTV